MTISCLFTIRSKVCKNINFCKFIATTNEPMPQQPEMPPSPAVEIPDEPTEEPISLEGFFDLTENVEQEEPNYDSDSSSNFEDLETESLDGDVENNFEFDPNEMVTVPDIFYNDVLTESKPNRMLDGILDFEGNKKLFSEMMSAEIPSLNEICSTGIAKIEKFTPRRNLDKDLEEVLKTKNDDIFGMPKKLSMNFNLAAILNSSAPILASEDDQIEYKKSYDHAMKSNSTQPPFAPPLKLEKSSPQFVVKDEFAPDLPTDLPTNDSSPHDDFEISNQNEEIEENNESEDLATQTDTSANNNVSLDHDYLQKRPLTDHDYVASLPKKTKFSDSDTDGHYQNSAFINFLIFHTASKV